jgi:hypothetical protein
MRNIFYSLFEFVKENVIPKVTVTSKEERNISEFYKTQNDNMGRTCKKMKIISDYEPKT